MKTINTILPEESQSAKITDPYRLDRSNDGPAELIEPETRSDVESKSAYKRVKEHIGRLATSILVAYESTKDSLKERINKIIKGVGATAVESTLQSLTQAGGEEVGQSQEIPIIIAEAVGRMEDEDPHLGGYAWVAPDIDDQVKEPGRNNIIRYLPSRSAAWGEDTMPDVTAPVEITEQKALQSLINFLDQYIVDSEDKSRTDAEVEKNREMAKAMRETLTYIGEKEYSVACEVIGQMWKSFLDSDSGNILCVLTKINKATGSSARKSDSFLFDSILSTFTDEEIEKYGDKIVTEMSDIPQGVDPASLRIVLLDDWTISGSQMRDAYQLISQSPEFSKYEGSVEINLITASKERIENGLRVYSSGSAGLHLGKQIKVKAVYKSHHSEQSTSEHQGHVTGSHSSVDFDFEATIGRFVRDYRDGPVGNHDSSAHSKVMPPCTNIVREYRKLKPKHISINGKIVRRT